MSSPRQSKRHFTILEAKLSQKMALVVVAFGRVQD
jgi:hypothetical protein